MVLEGHVPFLPLLEGLSQRELFPLSLEYVPESLLLNTLLVVTTNCLRLEYKKVIICLFGLDDVLKAYPFDFRISLLLP